jgi:hypothetical protein
MRKVALTGIADQPRLEWSIPTRFEERVFVHLIGNLLSLPHFPLILGIHGPPGQGKSFQCAALFTTWGIMVRRVSGSQLESSAAGGPSRVLKDEYKRAGSVLNEQGTAPCLFIEDIDAGIGDFGRDVTYTVNRQNVSATLMNLCDHPTILDGESVVRCPIVVTANRLDTLYGPLIRHQRMEKFYWEASLSEKTEIVTTVFSGILDQDDVQILLERFPNENISFFSHVQSRYSAAGLIEITCRQPRQTLFREISVSTKVREGYIDKIRNWSITNVQALISIAESLKAETDASTRALIDPRSLS